MHLATRHWKKGRQRSSSPPAFIWYFKFIFKFNFLIGKILPLLTRCSFLWHILQIDRTGHLNFGFIYGKMCQHYVSSSLLNLHIQFYFKSVGIFSEFYQKYLCQWTKVAFGFAPPSFYRRKFTCPLHQQNKSNFFFLLFQNILLIFFLFASNIQI